MLMVGASYQARGAWVLQTFGVLLFIISFAAPNWMTSAEGINSGLWRTCFPSNVEGKNVTLCGHLQNFVDDAWGTGWVPGTQAMFCLALVALLISGIFINLYMWLPQMERNLACVWIAMCATFTMSAFSFMGQLTYGIKNVVEFRGTSLSWAYIMSVFSTMFCFLATIFLLSECMELTRHMAIKKKKKEIDDKRLRNVNLQAQRPRRFAAREEGGLEVSEAMGGPTMVPDSQQMSSLFGVQSKKSEMENGVSEFTQADTSEASQEDTVAVQSGDSTSSQNSKLDSRNTSGPFQDSPLLTKSDTYSFDSDSARYRRDTSLEQADSQLTDVEKTSQNKADMVDTYETLQLKLNNNDDPNYMHLNTKLPPLQHVPNIQDKLKETREIRRKRKEQRSKDQPVSLFQTDTAPKGQIPKENMNKELGETSENHTDSMFQASNSGSDDIPGPTNKITTDIGHSLRNSSKDISPKKSVSKNLLNLFVTEKKSWDTSSTKLPVSKDPATGGVVYYSMELDDVKASHLDSMFATNNRSDNSTGSKKENKSKNEKRKTEKTESVDSVFRSSHFDNKGFQQDTVNEHNNYTGATFQHVHDPVTGGVVHYSVETDDLVSQPSEKDPHLDSLFTTKKAQESNSTAEHKDKDTAESKKNVDSLFTATN